MNRTAFMAAGCLSMADCAVSARGSVAPDPLNMHPVQTEGLNWAFQPLAFADLIET